MAREYEVISHTRMKHITAFLVQLEQRVTHIHRELEIGYVLEGSLSLRTGSRTETISQGDLYLVDRMEPHEFAAEGSAALVIAIQISPQLMEGFLTQGTHYRYEGSSNVRKDLSDDPRTYRLLCAACIALTHSFLCRETDCEFRCFSLCASLVYLLQKNLPWQPMGPEDYSAIQQRAKRIMEITDYIDRNFQRKLLLSEIAERENLSLMYLSHFFKDTMGMSFQEYLNRKRFEYACALLFTTERKILDISISSGFSDVRYFNEAFSAQYGCTPKEYRKGKLLQASRLQEEHQNAQSFFTEQDALTLLTPLCLAARKELDGYSLAELYN